MQKRNRHCQLTLQAKEIIRLRDVDGKKWREIADHFGFANISGVSEPYRVAKKELSWREAERKTIDAWLKESPRSIYRKQALRRERALRRIESMDENGEPLPVRTNRGYFGNPERPGLVAAKRERMEQLAKEFDAAEQGKTVEEMEEEMAALDAEIQHHQNLPIAYWWGERYWYQGRGLDDSEVRQDGDRYFVGNDEVRIVHGQPPPLPHQQPTRNMLPLYVAPDPRVEKPNVRWQVPDRPEPEDKRGQLPVVPGPPLYVKEPVTIEPGIPMPAPVKLLEPLSSVRKIVGTVEVVEREGDYYLAATGLLLPFGRWCACIQQNWPGAR